MSSTVFYDSIDELATIKAVFTNSAGSAADPTSVTCVVTDPSGAQVTHSYQGTAPADITRSAVGNFQLQVPASPSVAGVDGLWGYVFVGTGGGVTEIQPGTWRVLPAAISQVWYVGAEEMNDRLGITDQLDMSVMQTAIAASAGWINEWTGRHFNRVTETRTFVPHDIYEVRVDDIVPGATIAVSVDYDGDGIYEQNWVQGTDYQLAYGPDRFNLTSTGIARPYDKIRVISSGRTFPFLWPFAPLNRVQVNTTWGWPQVPWQVSEANRILAADFFRMKDAPFGIAGTADIGVARVNANPWVVELLQRFVKGGGVKVGV